MRLIPKDQRYFDLFDALGGHISTAGALLRELFDDPARQDDLVGRIRAAEHAADAAAHETIDRLALTFVTPLDREDIHLLATRLDTVVDLVEETAILAQIYRLREMPPAARHLARVIERAGRELAVAVGALRRRTAIMQHVRAIKALDQEADTVYAAAVAGLFAAGRGGAPPDALDVLKWKDVYSRLHGAAGECNRAAQLLERLAVKHG